MPIKKLGVITPRDKVQFAIAIGLMVFGGILLMIGLLAEPQGQIHQSVLIAFGEVATLAAGVLGIDAIYTNKLQKIVADLKKVGKEVEEE
jgi:hypothetical protein